MKPLSDKNKESVFVVVPVFNEAKVLRSTLKPLIESNYSVTVVDDGSNDGSWSILKSLPIHALRHPINMGQGAAIQTGTLYSLRQGAEIIVHFDADGQHRHQDIEILTQPILHGQADIVLGSRFLHFQHKKDVPLFKRVLLRIAIVVNGLITGLWLSDAHNGLRVLSRDAAEKICLLENGYAHASEIINQIKIHRLRYLEKPTKIRYSKYSKSKGQSFWNAFNIVIDMLLRGLFK